AAGRAAARAAGSGFVRRFGRALGAEPGFRFGFLSGLDRSLGRGFPLGAQLGDQRFAIVALFARGLSGFPGRPGALGRPGDRRVELALRAQAERDRILWLDVLDVPVRPVADRIDRVARGPDQLADLCVGNFWVVAQDPGDAVGLVLPLRDRRVARPLGPTDVDRGALHLQAIVG